MRLVVSFVLMVVLIPPALAQQFGIDSPLPNSVQSGTVAPTNGWICPRNGEITARIDGGPVIDFFEDLSRGDTAGPCGNSGNNAFGTLPWNWNLSGDGAHAIEFFDAGEKFTEVSFTVVTFGTEFLFGPSASVIVADFPDPGADVEVSWDAAIQNFRMTQVIEEPVGVIPDGRFEDSVISLTVENNTITVIDLWTTSGGFSSGPPQCSLSPGHAVGIHITVNLPIINGEFSFESISPEITVLVSGTFNTIDQANGTWSYSNLNGCTAADSWTAVRQ